MNLPRAFFTTTLCQIALGISCGYSQESAEISQSKLVSPGETGSTQKTDRSASDNPTVGKHRFEPSASREYLVQRARRESEARRELLMRYQSYGLNFAQPTVDGMSLHPYPVRKKSFYVKPIQIW